MFLDFRREDAGASFETAVAVIGSGPAGLTIARELAAAGIDVILIESGGFDGDAATQALYDGDNAGVPHEAFDAVRMRFFGGSSNCWGGGCIPFENHDFEKRDWIPHSGWPITRRDLDPFYERALPVCGTGPYLYDDSVWSRVGQTPTDFDRERVRYCYWQLSAPLRFGEAYRADAEKAPSLKVLLNANATRIALNADGSQVEAIEIKSLSGHTGSVRARHFVVACGGIENARLMLASNDRMPAGAGNGHDAVGRYFMEHPYSTAGLAIAKPTDFLPTKPKSSNGLQFRFGLTTAPQVQEREMVYSAAVVFDLGEQRGDLFKTGGQLFPSAPEGYVRYSFVSQSEQSPKPESRVTLSSRRDALGNHLPRVDWRMDATDKRSIEVLMKMIGLEFARLGLGRVKLADWILDTAALWGVVANVHHMGTTRMGDDPKTSVVDKHCRVHGIANLHIAGSSVFVTSSYANPTLTIVALALRLADQLKTALVK